MPDEDAWQVSWALKRHVYAAYMADVNDAAYMGVYIATCKSHFNKCWREQFPEVKLRRHCRFSKCELCVLQRGILYDRSASAQAKNIARHIMELHIRWIFGSERSLYHLKKNNALIEPAKFISIAIDGTSQFPDGLPHFPEVTKSTVNGKRLQFHIEVVLTHGKPARVFLAPETIASDPNLTIHLLYTTLVEEEQRRGKLPPTLYLQLDNCARENKNTYVIMYLVWLVERRIFKVIYLSFLPVGHTHNDVDRFHSRIAVLSKYNDVPTISRLVDLLYGVYSPSPEVHVVESVGDIKRLFNPSMDKEFPVATAMCRRLAGCSTKTTMLETARYVGKTSPLHWQILGDGAGGALFRNRHTFGSGLWSVPAAMWNPEAPRPQPDRTCSDRISGLLPSDVKACPLRPLPSARLTELQSSLRACQDRLSDRDRVEIDDELQNLVDVIPLSQEQLTSLPPFDHSFRFENQPAGNDDNVPDESPPPALLQAPPVAIFNNPNEADFMRDQRRTRGHASNILVVGWYVAYTPDYLPSVPFNQRNDFWVGRITALDPKARRVSINLYNSSCLKNNADNTGAAQSKYKRWTGSVVSTATSDCIDVERVLETFQTFARNNKESGTIKIENRRHIRQSLTFLEQENERRNSLSFSDLPYHVPNSEDEDDDEDEDEDDVGVFEEGDASQAPTRLEAGDSDTEILGNDDEGGEGDSDDERCDENSFDLTSAATVVEKIAREQGHL